MRKKHIDGQLSLPQANMFIHWDPQNETKIEIQNDVIVLIDMNVQMLLSGCINCT